MGKRGAGTLAEPARAFDLPAERDEAERVVDELFAAMERIGQVHPFAKGMGIAAPQIGIGRAAAVVQPPGKAPAVILLNPRITTRSDETDEQSEGFLSFFDVRGLIPRPLTITVETTALTGETVTTVYERGLARRASTPRRRGARRMRSTVRATSCCTQRHRGARERMVRVRRAPHRRNLDA
ncbi:peptide deformylase [Streptomyces lydicus]|uniref:peptide deformylase n=1 Tax=Streptomyces lydicus TaxID=47763 RepID=UPI0037AFD676